MRMNLTETGYSLARAITKKESKSFYFASGLLPADKKYAAFSIYSICRASDDAVDKPENLFQGKHLERIKSNIDTAYADAQINDPLLLIFRQTVKKYGIPKDYFLTLTDGMAMDLYKTRYADFAQLYDYCYKAAGVIGLIMLKVFECRDPEAERCAINLGVGMQLINILRDIKEDYTMGRIYIPLEEMQRYGVYEEDISQGRLKDSLVDLLKFQASRARRYLSEARPGIKLIPNLRTRVVVCLMKEIYIALLNSIEKECFGVFSKRIYINDLKKFFIAAKVLLKGEYL